MGKLVLGPSTRFGFSIAAVVVSIAACAGDDSSKSSGVAQDASAEFGVGGSAGSGGSAAGGAGGTSGGSSGGAGGSGTSGTSGGGSGGASGSSGVGGESASGGASGSGGAAGSSGSGGAAGVGGGAGSGGGATDAGTDSSAGDAGDGGPGDAGDGAVQLMDAGMFPTSLGQLCGIGYDHVRDEVWVYPCSGATVHGFTPGGVALGTVPRPGESANDVDVDFAPTALTLGTASIAEGTMLFTNGETGVAEIYAIDTTVDAAPSVLTTAFGSSHVVGSSYHASRATIFAVQDRQVAAPNGNLMGELDPTNGSVLNTFVTVPEFSVNFGDIDVCQSTGNLFVVSSDESTMAEFTPTGTFLGEHALPATVSGLSGIAVDDSTGEVWLAGTSGGVWHVQGAPCSP